MTKLSTTSSPQKSSCLYISQWLVFNISYYSITSYYIILYNIHICCSIRAPRLQKCKACYKQLKNLSNIVKNRAEHVGRHGSTFKELQLLMAPLDN